MSARARVSITIFIGMLLFAGAWFAESGPTSDPAEIGGR